VVEHHAGSGVTAVDTADGPVPIDQETAAAVLREAGREDLIGERMGPARIATCAVPRP
jgi:hypothetical protein